MKYLLDTNVVSELSKPEPNETVTRWLGLVPVTETAISVVTLGEIERGILADPRPRRQQNLQHWYRNEFLVVFRHQILGITPPVMTEWAGRYQAARSRGQTPAVLDSLIAATAAAHGLMVVTRNTPDFEPMQVPTLNIWA